MMTASRSLAALAPFVLGFSLSGSAFAAEPSRVAVISVSGPMKVDVERAVEKALTSRPEVTSISRAKWEETARRLKLAPDSPEAIRDVAAELDVAAVIEAAIGREGRRWAATIQLRTPPDGKIRKVWKVRSKKVSRVAHLIEKQLWKKLGSHIPQAAEPTVVRRVVLLESEGSGRAKGQTMVLAELSRESNLQILEVEAAERIASDLGRDLDREEARVDVARVGGYVGWIALDLEFTRRRWQGTLTVFDGRTGEVVETVTAEASKLPVMARALARKADPALSRITAPDPGSAAPRAPAEVVKPSPPPIAKLEPREEPPAQRPVERPPTAKPDPAPQAVLTPPEPPPAPSAAPTSTGSSFRLELGDGEGRNRTPLEVTLGLSYFSRNLSYNDDIFGELRPYGLGGAPALRGRVAWYPAAHFTSGIATWFGVELGGAMALGLSSLDTAGNAYPSSALSWVASLKGRVPLGKHELGLAVGGGAETFSVGSVQAPAPGLPWVGYQFLRFGVDGRVFLFSGLGLRGGFGWRQVLSAGEIQNDEWFPRASANGIDASLALTFEVIKSVEIQLGAEARRYFYTLNPEPGDPLVAGGAVDQYLSGTFSVAWYLLP